MSSLARSLGTYNKTVDFLTADRTEIFLNFGIYPPGGMLLSVQQKAIGGGDTMPDLMLHEYKDLSEAEIGQMLDKELRVI